MITKEILKKWIEKDLSENGYYDEKEFGTPKEIANDVVTDELVNAINEKMKKVFAIDIKTNNTNYSKKLEFMLMFLPSDGYYDCRENLYLLNEEAVLIYNDLNSMFEEDGIQGLAETEYYLTTSGKVVNVTAMQWTFQDGTNITIRKKIKSKYFGLTNFLDYIPDEYKELFDFY